MKKYIRLIKRRMRKRKNERAHMALQEAEQAHKKHWLHGQGTRLTTKSSRLHHYRKKSTTTLS